MSKQKEYLIKLDSVVGDSDLGLTMSDGFNAAYKAADNTDEKDLGRLLYIAGKAMASAVPSTMGTLMASGFMQAGKEFKGITDIPDSDIVKIMRAFASGVMKRGKAKIGEKTFLDGWVPAVEAMEVAFKDGRTMQNAISESLEAAIKGYENTATMLAVHGRAATRGEASRSLKDPGAAVAILMITALKRTSECDAN